MRIPPPRGVCGSIMCNAPLRCLARYDDDGTKILERVLGRRFRSRPHDDGAPTAPEDLDKIENAMLEDVVAARCVSSPWVSTEPH